MMEAFLLNPPRRRARRRRGSARRRNRGNFGRRMAALRRARKSGGRKRRRNSWRGSSRRHARAARKGWRKRRHRSTRGLNPRRRRRSRRSRRRNPSRRSYRRSRRGGRRYSRRRRNYSLAAVRERSTGKIIEGNFDFVNIVRKPKNFLGAIFDVAVVGATAASSVVVSNIVVNGLAPLTMNMTPTVQRWTRPVLYLGVTGAMAMLGKWVGKVFFTGKGNEGKGRTLAIAAAVPPAIQTLGALLNAIAPNFSWGPLQPVINVATGGGMSGDDDDGMDDYLQMGDEGGGSDYGAGVNDYLQMGEMYEAGMGEMYEAGMGYDYDREEVESAAAPF